MQPTQQQQKGQSSSQTASQVTGSNGQALNPNQIQSIQLEDGWHDTTGVTLSYIGKDGSEQRASFNDVLSVADQPRER